MVAVAALQEDVPQEDIAPTQERPLTQHLCQAMVVAAMAALAGVAVASTLGLVVPVAITQEQEVAVAITQEQEVAVATTQEQGVAVATTQEQGEAVATTLASPLEAFHPFLQAFQALVLPQASPLYLPASQAQECLVGTGQGMVVGVGALQGLEEDVVVPMVGLVDVGHLGHHMGQ